MSFDLEHPGASNISLFRGYILVRQTLRRQEVESLEVDRLKIENGPDTTVFGSKAELLQKHADRVEECRVRHRVDQLDEAAKLAELEERTQDADRVRLLANDFRMLLHVLVGKRWMRGDESIESLRASITREEAKLRAMLSEKWEDDFKTPRQQ